MADVVRAPPSSTPSSSRLPAVSAADILRSLDSKDHDLAPLSTSVRALDTLLHGGFEKGKTAELWGPVGAGKTAIALTIAAKAVDTKQTVIWAACASPLSTSRIGSVLSKDSMKHFHFVNPPSLTHLLAFVQQPVYNEIFTITGLLVIDDLNALVDFDYPRQAAFASSSDSEARKWQAGRRALILAAIVSALNRLAVTHSIAVLVLNGCATSNRSSTGLGSVLVPAVGGAEWDAGIWNRLCIFQDFNGRFLALQKLQGSSTAGRGSVSPVLRFTLTRHGLLTSDDSLPQPSSASIMQTTSSDPVGKKRTYAEIADSEDEDEFEFGCEDFEDSDVIDTPVSVAAMP